MKDICFMGRDKKDIKAVMGENRWKHERSARSKQGHAIMRSHI